MEAIVYPSVETPFISSWTMSRSKRALDFCGALAAMLLLSPLAMVIAIAVLASSGRPVFFRQWRVGRNDTRFQLVKFRTMTVTAPRCGPGVTRCGDSRITPVGRWLRRWKLDEIPQVLNVLRGEMSFVGPRPDIESFWKLASRRDRLVLQLTPGLTGAASIAYCDEERLLAGVPDAELTSFYVAEVLPRKAALDMEYARTATLWSDCRILSRTALCPLAPERTGESVKL